MIIELQVCSRELAKRLNELGVKQRSLFYWYAKIVEGKTIKSSDWHIAKDIEVPYGTTSFSAFTSSELCRILGEHSNDVEYGFCHGQTDWHWWNKDDDEYVHADTDAGAYAKMLIHLLENKLITL